MTVFEKGLITICVSCVFFGVVSIPLILRKVPRNRVYGYRTRTTLSDDALWYDANAYFGRWFFGASVLAAATAVGLYLWRGISPGAYLRVSVLLLIVPAAIAVLLTARFVRSRLAGGRFRSKCRCR